MPLTDQDARALTYLAGRLRAETPGAGRWDDAGTHSVIAGLIGQNLAVTIERVVRHAADKDAKTPGAINRPFVPEGATPAARYPAKADDSCASHPGEWAHTCRACAADRLAGETERPPRRTHHERYPEKHAAGVDRLRAQLQPMSEED